MSDTARLRRAEERRSRATLVRTSLAREVDACPLAGEPAVSLVAALTRESWAAAGRVVPSYDRAHTPVRFVPRSQT